MKNLIFKIAVISLLITSIFSQMQTAFADFSDVDKSNPNYNAIIYLQSQDIINGYADGTFQPKNNVNRAEFLKIILEGSNIPLNEAQATPFSDIPDDAWYAPYIRKAYSEGWVVGYTDGTFKPEQTINKAEALKILGEVQNWALPSQINKQPFTDVYKTAWYTPYIVFAKEKGYLEETGLLFVPDKLMTRAKISEIIYRTLTLTTDKTNNENSDNTDENLQIDNTIDDTIDDTYDNSTDDTQEDTNTTDEIEEINFTPKSYTSYDGSFYDKIRLDRNFPNTFYKNEVYIFEGEITSGNYDSATAILDGTSNSEYQTFTTSTSGSRFAIPVRFTEQGNYNLGIIPGESGESVAVQISVLPSLPATGNTTNSSALSYFDLTYEDDETDIVFSSSSSSLKRFVITQGSKKVTYLSRQNINTMPVQYSDFDKFSENSNISIKAETALLSSEMPLTIASEFTQQETQSHKIAEHTYSYMSDDISATVPDTFSSVEKISFSATIDVDTALKAYVIKPNGLVDEFDLTTSSPTSTYAGSTIILGGGSLTFSYTPSTSGRYIIEINDKNGIALINHSIYIGNAIPLTPDFFDSHERDFYAGNVNLTSMRNEMLEYINNSRKDHGLKPIELSSELNSLAQGHSDDMVNRNFFGHINPDEETPDARRIAAGISTPVSENIAQDVNLEFAHWGLMRSAAHRSNILTEEWTRVGIGITLDDGYLYITEEFSTDELTSTNFIEYRDDLFAGINEVRSDNGISTLNYNTGLSSAATYVNDKQIDEDATITQSILDDALSLNGINGTTELNGISSNSWNTIFNSILNDEPSILESSWTDIGIDIQTDSLGTIYTIFMLNY